jgi:hypothetical protein
MNVTAKFDGLIDAKKTEIDIEQPPIEIEIFNHYSPEGSIPVIVIGGKYFRVGSGEFLGEEAEAQVLTALLCKVTNSSIADCSQPAVAELVNAI